MEGGGGRKRKGGPINLDWETLLPFDDKDDEPPPVLVIKEAAEESKPPEVSAMGDREDQYIKHMSDKELSDKTHRIKCNFESMSSKLPDGGEKLRLSLRQMEEELERRALLKSDGKYGKATPAFSHAGLPIDLSPPGSPLSRPASQSTFAYHFCSKMDDKRATKPPSFTEEISIINPTECKNMRVKRQSQTPQMTGLSTRQTPFKSPCHLSLNIDVPPQSNSARLGNHSSTPSPHHSDKDVSRCFPKKETASCFQPLRNTRRNNRKPVVVVDEEDIEVDVKDHEDRVGQSSKETRIYYPSRDDPNFVEVCISDLECLAPESFLSSTIMNFYIRYLQKLTPTAGKRCDYHFFYTFFYQKLKSNVLNKSDRETSFKKFRRWWKGVNIFEKAYIFLPIHENLHWSLVIICIPDKEDESGPIILHLDSLKFHSSKQIFNDVKSFLVEEWKFLRQEVLPEPPIADRIWERLSRRIDENVIEVPQQKNEYDCGLFVLFYIERFIEDSPERLKKKDLEKFDKEWFRPEEASSLRRRISDLLQEEFKNANECT